MIGNWIQRLNLRDAKDEWTLLKYNILLIGRLLAEKQLIEA